MIPFNYFRALFPQWSFYDQVAYQFELEFKILGSEIWHPVLFTQSRKIFGLFINPESNLKMASINIIEHFATEIQSHPEADVDQLTSFKLLKSLLKTKLAEYEFSAKSVQLRVVAVQNDKKEVIYFSHFFKLDEL